MISGIGGDSGKTLVTLGLIQALRHEAVPVSSFKKGPDYIDPAWLTLASGVKTRNIDTWMMGTAAALGVFCRHADPDGISVIEANRGLHDGEDSRGTHSSAEMAKLLKCPVVLVLPAIKVTRTLAAIVYGIKLFDREVDFAGVVVNQVATKRQANVIRRAIEDETDIPVLGMIPRIRKDPLPGRHLGLVTPEEHETAQNALQTAGKLISENADVDRLKSIASVTKALNCEPVIHRQDVQTVVHLGYFKSPAFTFYYPDNLEALEHNGAELVEINPGVDTELPDIDGLYIGGGFPETHAPELSENEQFHVAIRQAIEDGMPVFAECGGLMFLSRSIAFKGETYPMAGVFDVDITLTRKPAGHGYVEVTVDNDTPFFSAGTSIRGHEFHYSQVITTKPYQTALKLSRGTGLGDGRDGLIYKNAMASYLHIHSVSTPEWAENFITSCKKYRKEEL